MTGRTDEAVVLRVERRVESGPPSMRVETSPLLVLPIEGSVVDLVLEGADPARLDGARFALVPANVRYRLHARSAITNVVALVLGRRARVRACREYQPYLLEERLESILREPRVLARTRWFHEIVHRYVFERDVCRKDESAAARFLEAEIVKELYFFCVEREESKVRDSVARASDDAVDRVRAWVDSHLFSPLPLARLARVAGTSEATLSRAFRRELQVAPATYVRERRLDAALLLLQSERSSVGEVAVQVGYSTLASFTAAFTRRFHRTPSSVRSAHAVTGRLAPHGKPLDADGMRVGNATTFDGNAKAGRTTCC